MTASAGVTIVNPTSGPLERRDTRSLPPRPSSLHGATVGLIANGLGESVALFQALAEELQRELELAGAIVVKKANTAIAPSKQDWQRLVSEATVVVTGFGG